MTPVSIQRDWHTNAGCVSSRTCYGGSADSSKGNEMTVITSYFAGVREAFPAVPS